MRPPSPNLGSDSSENSMFSKSRSSNFTISLLLLTTILREKFGPTDRSAPEGRRLRGFYPALEACAIESVVVALPRSSQPFGSHSRCRDDLTRSEREVVDAYSQLNSSCKLDQEKIILSGFSQGATLAIYLALKRSLPARGFVAIAPASTIIPSHSEEFTSFVKAVRNPDSRGWILVGDKDRFFERINVLHSSMKQNGLESEYVIEKGLGHDYPNDFALKLGRALDFVLR